MPPRYFLAFDSDYYLIGGDWVKEVNDCEATDRLPWEVVLSVEEHPYVAIATVHIYVVITFKVLELTTLHIRRRPFILKATLDS